MPNTGIELATLRSLARRSNQISYATHYVPGSTLCSSLTLLSLISSSLSLEQFDLNLYISTVVWKVTNAKGSVCGFEIAPPSRGGG